MMWQANWTKLTVYTLNENCNKVAKIEGEVKKRQSDTSLMDGKVKATETKVEEMDKGLTWLNEQVEQLQSKIKNMEDTKEKEFSELYPKQLYAEAYSRRENLKFFGLRQSKMVETRIKFCVNLSTMSWDLKILLIA